MALVKSLSEGERRVPMNNNLYSRHDEQMVRHEMREVDHAVEQARLLREAGLSGPSWLSRAAKVLRNLLEARSKRFQDHHSIEPQAYQSDELAP
jgi:tetraacyldisaccharide-1-P 4'-kinase